MQFSLKRDCGTGAFLWDLQNVQELQFWRKSVNDCFWCLNRAHIYLMFSFFDIGKRGLEAVWYTVHGRGQKQPPRGVLNKRYSANIQQIYRRAPMSKCGFNKVEKQVYWNYTSSLVFSCKLAAYFKNTFF